MSMARTGSAGGADYHARVAAAFGRYADAEPERFARIDGLGEQKRSMAASWPPSQDRGLTITPARLA
jgi:hypothetical protein